MPLRISCGIFLAAALAIAIPALDAQTPAKAAQSATKSTALHFRSGAQNRHRATAFRVRADLSTGRRFDNAAKEYRRAIAIGLDHLGNSALPGRITPVRNSCSSKRSRWIQMIRIPPWTCHHRAVFRDMPKRNGHKGGIAEESGNFRARVLLGKIAFAGEL